jgi:hypothetical protein
VDAWVDGCDVVSAAGFEKDGEASVAERFHEREGGLLQERFTASEFDERELEV